MTSYFVDSGADLGAFYTSSTKWLQLERWEWLTRDNGHLRTTGVPRMTREKIRWRRSAVERAPQGEPINSRTEHRAFEQNTIIQNSIIVIHLGSEALRNLHGAELLHAIQLSHWLLCCAEINSSNLRNTIAGDISVGSWRRWKVIVVRDERTLSKERWWDLS